MLGTDKTALIVGGGIIGLTTSFRLARDGWRVTLLDPSPGRGATWAAAGMVAPSAEASPGERSNYELQCGALAAWRDMAVDLERMTGETLELHATGTLLVGWDASDRRLVERFVDVAVGFGVRCQMVTRASHDTAFHGLSARITEGCLVEGDAWIDPDQAVSMLLRAVDQLGVRVERERVTSIEELDDCVRATTASRTFEGRLGVVATGAAPPPPFAGVEVDQRVRPVRGMTVRIEGIDRSAAPTVRAYVHGHAFYMVSRPGGYCVVGATAEERADAVVEVGELQRLLRDALDIVPALESARVVETRVGLRPATHDLEPFFEVLGRGRWAWSSGHYRHGVTLAPIAAQRALDYARDRT